MLLFEEGMETLEGLALLEEVTGSGFGEFMASLYFLWVDKNVISQLPVLVTMHLLTIIMPSQT